MIQVNQTINWVPHNIRDGRFGKWLENARDWAISRNRYWGTPIPIWRSDAGDCIVISSIADLERRTGQKVTDLHRHHIDALSFTENGKVYKRIPEVFDCWFDAGSMPYAQKHYPFENQEETMNAFPADFIAEGLDQTRGWFYTLTILSTALFDQPAFKQVIVNGIILAEDGTKMSKRLKNYPEPGKVFNEYGADAVRMYLLNSPVVAAEDLRFSEKGVEGVLRQLLLPLWNSYFFLATYAKIYAWDPETVDKKAPEALIDRWILSLLEGVVQKVTDGMDRYELQLAVSPLIGFVDQLTNWYIRRSRSRFWADERSQDRDEAFATLYRVLVRFAKTAAPFIPFITEEIFHGLRTDQDPVSVHLCDYPLYDAALRDFALEEEMRFVQTAVTTGHALRKEHQLKVRQPLKKAFVVCAHPEILESLKRQAHLIGDELNVKEITCMGDESQFVTIHAKPNFRVLGKKVGKKMVAVQKEIEQMDKKLLEQLLSGKSVSLFVDGEEIVVTPEDVAVERKAVAGRVAATSDGITIALDTELTPELIQEGFAREIINKVNTMRRESGFAVTDRIAIKMQVTDSVRSAFEAFYTLICHEVLATDVLFGPCAGVTVDLNGEEVVIQLAMV